MFGALGFLLKGSCWFNGSRPLKTAKALIRANSKQFCSVYSSISNAKPVRFDQRLGRRLTVAVRAAPKCSARN